LNLLIIFFTLLLTTEVPPAVPNTGNISWSSELGLTSLASIDAKLSELFPYNSEWNVTLKNRRKLQVKTCNDYLATTKQLVEVEEGTVMDYDTLEMSGAHCYALSALKTAKLPLKTYLRWFQFSVDNIEQLTPSLTMLEIDEERLATKAEKACIPWNKFDKDLKIQIETQEVARLTTDSWTGRLRLYGRADFNGDGIEDLLLQRSAHVVGGSEAETTIYIITQTSKKRCPKTIRVMGLGYSYNHPLK
jgi:hypothetical protein